MIKALLFTVVLLSALFVAPIMTQSAFAQDQTEIIKNLDDNSDNDANTTFGLPNNEPTDSTIRAVLQTVFLIAGAVSVIFTAVGGLRYVLSEGNDQKIKQAKDTITYAIVGLIVSTSAYAIVSFFLRGILS